MILKHSKLPITILAIYLVLTTAMALNWIPSGLTLLEQLSNQVGEHWFALVVFCIFLESLIVVSLYFPGQYIAAILVIYSNPTNTDIALLSLAMVIATTAGSTINYLLGKKLSSDSAAKPKPISYKSLLPALIHSSGLAIFTFHWGQQNGSAKLISVAALLNTPYYLLIMFATANYGNEIMAATDKPLLIVSILSIWLAISLRRDWRNRDKQLTAVQTV
jgi:membrane-associated protein